MKLLNKLPMPDDMEKEEIVQLLLKEEYGFLLKGKTEVFADLVEKDEKFCAGKAVLNTLRLICRGEFGEFSFPVMYSKNLSEGKKPCFIHINRGRGRFYWAGDGSMSSLLSSYLFL